MKKPNEPAEHRDRERDENRAPDDPVDAPFTEDFDADALLDALLGNDVATVRPPPAAPHESAPSPSAFGAPFVEEEQTRVLSAARLSQLRGRFTTEPPPTPTTVRPPPGTGLHLESFLPPPDVEDEADDPERTVLRRDRRSRPAAPPSIEPTKPPSTPLPPLPDPARLADLGDKSVWAERAEWIEVQAQAAADPEARVRGLIVASELWAIAGEPERAREVATEAAAIGHASSFSDRQLRWLSLLDADPEAAATVLDMEAQNAPTEAAGAHAAYLGAELRRICMNDVAEAKARYEAAARRHPSEVLPQLMCLADQLSSSGSPPKLEWRQEHAELARATEELGKLRSPLASAPGTPFGTFEEVRRALAAGQREQAATALLSLAELEGVGAAASWLAAALFGAEARTRGESIAVLERLAESGGLAHRALALRALEHGDTETIERVLGADANVFEPAERVALALLAPLAEPTLERLLADVAEDPSQGPLVAAAGLTQPLGSASGEPLVLRLGAALARSSLAGDPTALARALDELEALDPDSEALRTLRLELAAERGDGRELARRLETWPALSPRAFAERELAAAFVRELHADTEGARASYERALEADPTSEGALRALLPGVSRERAAELIFELAMAEPPGPRAALHFLEAALRAGTNDTTLFDIALERAREADPNLLAVHRLGEEAAHERLDLEGRLAWMRARRALASDAEETAFELVREALLVADQDASRAATLLREALEIVPSDLALVEWLAQLSPAADSNRARAWEAAAEAASTDRAELFLVAALEYERSGDVEHAYRAAERALEAEPQGFARPLIERLATRVEDATAPLEALEREAEAEHDPERRREIFERLAELSRARGDHDASLRYLRAALSVAPEHLPALRGLEAALLASAAGEELASVERALSAVLDGKEAAAAALLALRLLPAETEASERRALLARAVEKRPDALWALRALALDPACDPELLLTANRTLAALASPGLDRATLSLRAAEAAARLDRLAEARALVDQALEAVPEHPVALATLARLLERAADFAEAARAYETLAGASQVAEHAAAAWHRAAVLWLDHVGDPERGRIALERAAELDLGHEETVLRLQSLYVAQGAHHELAALLERRIARASDPEERMALEVARSRVLGEVGEYATAKAALARAIDANPGHVDALEAFAELCRKDGDWVGTEQALLRLSRHATTPERQVEVYRKLAELYDTTLPHPERAELAYREVLKRAPDDANAVDRLISIYAELGKRDAAVRIASEFLERAKEPEAKHDRIVRLAWVLERIANDRAQAESLLERARREAPHDARILRALVELRRRAGDESHARALLERASSDARRALGTGRFEVSFFETLATVAELRGAPDTARLAHATLAALLGDELPLVGAGERAGSPELDDLLAPELLEPRLRAWLHRVGSVLDAAYPLDLRALRAAPIPPGSRAYLARVQKLAESFGLETIEVLVSPTLGSTCLPVSSAPAKIVVGQEMLSAAEEPVRFALLVRALQIVKAHAATISRCSPVDLVPMMAGLVAAIAKEGVPHAGVDARKAEEARTRIAEAMPAPLVAELATTTATLAPLIGTRSSQLGSAVSQWGTRTALLATGDLNTTFRALANAAGRPPPPERGTERIRWIVRVPEARDAAIFGVSDAYAEARRRLGLGS